LGARAEGVGLLRGRKKNADTIARSRHRAKAATSAEGKIRSLPGETFKRSLRDFFLME